MLKRIPWRPSPTLASSADIKHHIASRRRSPVKAAGLLLGLVFMSIVAGMSVVVLGYFSPALIVLLLLLGALLYDFRVGVIALFLVYPLAATRFMPSFSGINPQNLLLLGTLISFGLHRLWRKLPYRLLDKRLLVCYLLPFLVAGVLGARHAGALALSDAADSVSTPKGFMIYYVAKPALLIVLAWMIAAAARESARPQRFLTAFALSSMVPALFICAYIAISGVSLSALVTFRSFLSPLGLHSNQFAVVLNFGIATALFTGLAASTAGRRWLMLSLAAFLSMVLLLTFSRGGYAGFALILIAYFVYARAGMQLLVGLIVLAIALFFVPQAVMDRVTLGVTHGGVQDLSSGRLTAIWPPLLGEALNSPVWGHGLAYVGRSELVAGGRMMAVGQAHNAYLDLLLDMGLVGLVLVVTFMVSTYRDFVRLSKEDDNPLFRGFFKGASVGMLAMLLQAFTDDHLTPNMPQMLFWMAYGLLLARLPRMEARAGATPGTAPAQEGRR